MSWKTLDDMDLDGKVVLTRVDINVPVQDGHVTDDTRIRRIVPTVRDILAKGGKPGLVAHFGRPKGQKNLDMSLAPVAGPFAISVSAMPIAMGPNPAGARRSVAPKITNKKMKVSTISVTRQDSKL